MDDDAELGEEPTQGFSAVDPSGAEDRGFTVRVGGGTSATEKFLPTYIFYPDICAC